MRRLIREGREEEASAEWRRANEEYRRKDSGKEKSK